MRPGKIYFELYECLYRNNGLVSLPATLLLSLITQLNSVHFINSQQHSNQQVKSSMKSKVQILLFVLEKKY